MYRNFKKEIKNNSKGVEKKIEEDFQTNRDDMSADLLLQNDDNYFIIQKMQKVLKQNNSMLLIYI